MIRNFKQPQMVEEAVSLYEHYSHAGYYAGGTSINHMDTASPYTNVISIGELGLGGISLEGGLLRVGAAVRLQELIDSTLVMPVIKEAARGIYSRSVRNMATVGGNIAACWTHSALVPSLIVLGARVELADGSTVTVEEYVDSSRGDLITAVLIPINSKASAVRRVRQSSASKVIMSFALSMWFSADRKCLDPRLVATGFGERPMRLPLIEELLTKREDHSVHEFDLAFRELNLLVSDAAGTAAYKNYIAARTVIACAEACREVLS